MQNITITFNDKPMQLDSNINVADFLEQHIKAKPPFALAINSNFVAKSSYATTVIASGDIIELVMPMQGG